MLSVKTLFRNNTLLRLLYGCLFARMLILHTENLLIGTRMSFSLKVPLMASKERECINVEIAASLWYCFDNNYLTGTEWSSIGEKHRQRFTEVATELIDANYFLFPNHLEEQDNLEEIRDTIQNYPVRTTGSMVRRVAYDVAEACWDFIDRRDELGQSYAEATNENKQVFDGIAWSLLRDKRTVSLIKLAHELSGNELRFDV